MKVYVVTYGWETSYGSDDILTPRVFFNETDAKLFSDDWILNLGWGRKYKTPFARYDEIEVE